MRWMTILTVMITLLASIHARPSPSASHELYHEYLSASRTIRSTATLRVEQLLALADSIQAVAETKQRFVGKSRWNFLLEREAARLRLAAARHLINQKNLVDAENLLRMISPHLDAVAFFAASALLELTNDRPSTAMDLAIRALYHARDPEVETIARQAWDRLVVNEADYASFRDKALASTVLFMQSPDADNSQPVQRIPRKMADLLFRGESGSAIGVLAFWDEFLDDREEAFLREAYQAASSIGIPFRLIYAGSNPELARLHLPPGIPVAGINPRHESKLSAKLGFVQFPTLLVVLQDGEIRFRSSGLNRSFSQHLRLLRGSAVKQETP